MPLRSIINTARALSYYTMRQEIAANNLANVSTGAYKSDRVVARNASDSKYPIPEVALDLTQGTLRDTGRPLDLALEGPGFLVVKTAAGERLTRGGGLSLDPGGMLIDVHGDPILGVDGPLVLDGKDIQFGSDGSVTMNGAPVGSLRIVTVADPATIAKEGNGRFVATGATIPATDVKMRQGSLEEANFDSVPGLVDLITIQRAWAANTEAMKVMDGVLGITTGEIGRV